MEAKPAPTTVSLMECTFYAECSIHENVMSLLTPGELVIACFQTTPYGDSAVFTDKRVIIRDTQGNGKNERLFSMLLTSIYMWSAEDSDITYGNAAVRLWTRAGHIRIELMPQIDHRQFYALLSAIILKDFHRHMQDSTGR